MPIQQSRRPIAAARLVAVAWELLNAAPLCAIATMAPGGRAWVNTAYFAWTSEFDLVWLSEPRATHSRNIRTNGSAAIAVYDSSQSWAAPDRGIQLFGSALELEQVGLQDAVSLYQTRFAESRETDLSAYRVYRFRPRRLKLFDELELGAGVFVTARVGRRGRLTWERTDVYRSA
jgi:uncharacterized protein YhbP (UPF0306 family)